jgi:hypothetical protein
MKNYNIQYKKYEKNRKKISPNLIERGNFYLLKEYIDVEGNKNSYSENDAPIIFVLFASKAKNEIHAIKVTNMLPAKMKKLFENLINEDTNEIELQGSSKKIYNAFLKKVPTITNETYRTYKWDGIKRIIKLDMLEEAVVPKKYINKKGKI